MADKWADYIITAVRFNSTGTHIEAVQIRADNGDTAGPGAKPLVPKSLPLSKPAPRSAPPRKEAMETGTKERP